MTPSDARTQFIYALLGSKCSNQEILAETKQLLIDVLDLLDQHSNEEDAIIHALTYFDL